MCNKFNQQLQSTDRCPKLRYVQHYQPTMQYRDEFIIEMRSRNSFLLTVDYSIPTIKMKQQDQYDCTYDTNSGHYNTPKWRSRLPLTTFAIGS